MEREEVGRMGDELQRWKDEVNQLRAMYESALMDLEHEQEESSMWADKYNIEQARADEAEGEVARLTSSLEEYANAAQTAIALAIGRIERHEPGAALTGLRCAVDRLAALTPEDTQ